MKMILFVIGILATLISISMAVRVGTEPKDTASKIGLLFFGLMGAVNLHLYMTVGD